MMVLSPKLTKDLLVRFIESEIDRKIKDMPIDHRTLTVDLTKLKGCCFFDEAIKEVVKDYTAAGWEVKYYTSQDKIGIILRSC